MNYRQRELKEQGQMLVLQTLVGTGRSPDWNTFWKLTGMTRGVFGRRLVECIKNGWIKMGGTVKNDRLVSLFELNHQMVDVSPFGLTVRMPQVPYSYGKLRKREFVFRAGKPGLVRDYLLKSSKYHPNRIRITEREAVSSKKFHSEKATP